jgi:uroporphyrinogen decarboxylase
MTIQPMTPRERFLAVMEYQPVDRVPNYEVGVWTQTADRWQEEGLDIYDLHWDWFTGEERFDMDPREYIPVNFHMVPTFEEEILEENERYILKRNGIGIVTRALKEGTVRGMRASMDEYVDFPVKTREDFQALKKRFTASHASRYPPMWESLMLPRWRNREHPLILGRNCATLGFYWRAREFMGTEGLSYAWYDQPALMHEMMEFIADFTMQVAAPVLDKIAPDYIFINEDLAMKTGPLLSPRTYKTFIYPHLKRMIEYFKSKGVRYVIIDSDGNTEPLLTQMMDAGVDGIWPLERASDDTDPAFLRQKYGKSLRLWGAVDKRELAKDKAAIDAHLRTFIPLIEEGGFIPTVDHLVSPDVSYENFLYYMARKQDLLRGKL